MQQTAQETPVLNHKVEELTAINSQLTQQRQTAHDTQAAQAQQLTAAIKELAGLKEALTISQTVIASLQQRPPQSPSVEPQPVSEATAPAAPAADEISPDSSSGIAGRSIVITGTLKDLTYDQVTRLIADAGGRINKLPSANTDYIVVGKNPGSKLKKAEKYGTPQLNESQLLALFEQP